MMAEAQLPGPVHVDLGSFSHLPTTRQGRIAVVLFAISLVAFGAFVYLFAPIQGTEGDAGWRGVAAQLAAVTALIAGLGGSEVALAAVIRSHERSWAAYVALLPLAALLAVVVWELISAASGTSG